VDWRLNTKGGSGRLAYGLTCGCTTPYVVFALSLL
jgi:hypothetical protein